MKNYFLILALFLSSNTFAQNQDNPIDIRIHPPVLGDMHGAEPKEDRGLEYKKFLEPSLKISVKAGSGSGTIIYYDKLKNIAYVATCGHLWPPGVMTADQAKKKNMKCSVITWYKNGKKLDQPVAYQAEVLFYSYTKGCDTALIQFSPDYSPEYFTIGPKNYNYIKGKTAHSMGCDLAKEVAHYEVEVIGIYGDDLVTRKNSPRPGRSGGGLVDENGTYIGTCWGTSDIDGSGEGFFTPLKAIHSFWVQNGYEFLLVNKEAKKIKIYDMDSRNFIDQDLILIPDP